MQKTVYECDHCKKVIGGIAHITLSLQTNHPGTGVAMPPGNEVEGYHGRSGWKTVKLPRSFVHFHIGCIERYFKAIVTAATKKVPAKKK